MRGLVEAEAKQWVGRTIADRYALVRLVGCGGMGAVFEARHRFTRGTVAVKLLLSAESSSSARRRFVREGQVLTGLDHPSIVRVYDLGEDQGVPYLVEAFLPGSDLRARLRSRGACAPSEAVAWMRAVLSALGHAHRAGVVHRDVKPENIVLVAGDDGAVRPVLVDFGVARVIAETEAPTQTGALLGTPTYMAPEQCLAGKSVDARCDVWAVGVVLFELLSGRAPFTGSATEVLGALLTLEAPRLSDVVEDAPEALVAVVAKALARDVSARFASAEAFAEALGGCGAVGDEPLRAVATTSGAVTMDETAPSRGVRTTVVAKTASRWPPLAMMGAGFVALTLAMMKVAPREVATPARPRVMVRAEPRMEAVPVVVAHAVTVPRAAPTVAVPTAARIVRTRHATVLAPRSPVIAREAEVSVPSSPHARGANGALILEP